MAAGAADVVMAAVAADALMAAAAADALMPPVALIQAAPWALGALIRAGAAIQVGVPLAAGAAEAGAVVLGYGLGLPAWVAPAAQGPAGNGTRTWGSGFTFAISLERSLAASIPKLSSYLNAAHLPEWIGAIGTRRALATFSPATL
jgi:hypothetical protein